LNGGHSKPDFESDGDRIEWIMAVILSFADGSGLPSLLSRRSGGCGVIGGSATGVAAGDGLSIPVTMGLICDRLRNPNPAISKKMTLSNAIACRSDRKLRENAAIVEVESGEEEKDRGEIEQQLSR